MHKTLLGYLKKNILFFKNNFKLDFKHNYNLKINLIFFKN